MWVEVDLIGVTETVNEYGDHVLTETRRTVLADDYSVGMTETYQAMAVGYKPEVKLVLTNWLDYCGEEYVEFVPFGRSEAVRLKILRTYRNGEALELTCYKGVEKDART